MTHGARGGARIGDLRQVAATLAALLLLAAGATLGSTEPDEADWLLRWEDCVQLVETGDADASARLAGLVEQDPSHWIRARALESLALVDPAAAAPEARRLVSDGDPLLRAGAVVALGRIGDAADCERLQQALDDEEPAVRDAALLGWARLAGGEAWPQVSAALAGDRASGVDAAIAALPFVAHEEARAAFRRILDGGERDQRRRAVLAIADSADPEALLLHALAREGDRDLEALLWASVDRLPEARRHELLLRMLASGERRHQRGAMQRLDNRATPGVAAIVRERIAAWQDDHAIALGLHLLAAVDADRHREFFARHLTAESRDLRIAAIRSLARCSDPGRFAAVSERLTDPDKWVRLTATGVLCGAHDWRPEQGWVAYLAGVLGPGQDDEQLFAGAAGLLAEHISAAELPAALDLLGPRLRGADDRWRGLAASALADAVDVDLVRRVCREQGLVVDWWVLAPLPPDGGAVAEVLPEDSAIDPAQALPGACDRLVSWARYLPDRVDGRVDLRAVVGEVDDVDAHALIDLLSPGTRRVVIEIAGAGRIHIACGEQRWTLADGAEQRHELTLAAGRNRLQVRAGLGDRREDCWFRLRIEDDAGEAVMLEVAE